MHEHDHIILREVNENNLKNISLKIPKKRITIFTGVSGSGKSSIVFDTISREAQRQLNQTFTTFIQNRLPKYSQPDALSIENLSPAIVIDQKRLGGNARSTLGTATDIDSLLRLLFSRIGEPYTGESDIFSFNNPKGMCPECEGIGRKIEPDLEKLFDKTKSLNEGAILYPTFSVGSAYWKRYVYSGLFDNDKKLDDYTADEWHTLLYGKGGRMEIPLESGGSVHSDYEGVLVKFKRLYIQKEASQHSEKPVRRFNSSHR